jgi:hypothetical protein
MIDSGRQLKDRTMSIIVWLIIAGLAQENAEAARHGLGHGGQLHKLSQALTDRIRFFQLRAVGSASS